MEDIDENWIAWNSMDKFKYAVLLICASGSGTLLSHPFYVLTTRQQAGTRVTGDKMVSNSVATGFSTGFASTVARIGWRGLFRGWLPLSVMSIPANVLYYSSTESSREIFRSKIFSYYPQAPLLAVDALQAFASGVIANCLFQLVYTPGEVVAARMIVQNASSRTGLLKTIRGVYSDFGARGFYRGYSASFCTGVMSSSIWWCSYSASRRTVSALLGPGTEDAVHVDAICGMVSGFAETVCVHPLDTLRARIMTGATRYSSLHGSMTCLVRQEGLGALWRGLYPSLCQTLISSCIFAMGYELIKRSSSPQKY